jgi:hypothetical protein
MAEQDQLPSSTTCKEEVSFDDMMTRIGEIGCYQWTVFVALSAGIMAECMVVFVYVFVAATPAHFCSTPELDHLNLTESMRLNLTVPPDEGGTIVVEQVCEINVTNEASFELLMLFIILELF